MSNGFNSTFLVSRGRGTDKGSDTLLCFSQKQNKINESQKLDIMTPRTVLRLHISDVHVDTTGSDPHLVGASTIL